MKLQSLALSSLIALLPLSAIAAPAPVEAAAAAAAAPTPLAEANEGIVARDTSPEALGLVKRAVRCKILGTSTVKCRNGPGFNYAADHYVTSGEYWTFDCYKSGDCYQGNWFVGPCLVFLFDRWTSI